MNAMIIPPNVRDASARDLYIDLIKRVLINHIYQDRGRSWATNNMDARYDAGERFNGEDHPHVAHTMIGWRRLSNIEHCVRTVLEDGVPGDMIETGVWRGGAVIFMRAILAAYGVKTRRVWVADSFGGVPPPSRPEDNWSDLHELVHLAVSVDEVRKNFRRYGLLDEQVLFLEGLFEETLPKTELPAFSVIRLDGDLYSSTRVSLVNLYPRLSAGGFIIVDDYHTFDACKAATEEYRSAHGIDEPLVRIDRNAVYWRKLSHAQST